MNSKNKLLLTLGHTQEVNSGHWRESPVCEPFINPQLRFFYATIGSLKKVMIGGYTQDIDPGDWGLCSV